MDSASLRMAADDPTYYRFQVEAPALESAILENVITEFQARYSVTYNRETVGIRIAEFIASSEMEDMLIRWSSRVLSSMEGFYVSLNNFGASPSGDLFLRVLDSTSIQELIAKLAPLDRYIQDSDFPGMRFVRNPQLLIASSLDGKIYDQALADYAREDFHLQFPASRLSLLKRCRHDVTWKTVASLALNPAIGNTKV